MSELCRRCAACCKNFPFVALSPDEVRTLEELTGLPALEFTNPGSDATRELILRFKEDGDCVFLHEENGVFTCGVYEARSAICRNYPWEPSQDEACDANRKMTLRNNPG